MSEGVEYRLGPFRLALPPGWSGSFEDGVHTLENDATYTAIQIGGFEREAPVEMSDLYGMVPEGAEGLSRFTLPSGLDGFGWTEIETGDLRQVIRSGSVVLAVSVLYGDADPDMDAETVEAVLGSFAWAKGDAA